MFEKVLETIEKFNMLSNKDRVIVAVSGGPDSIALLHVLHKLMDRYEITLYAAHLNHMLRGEESEKDTQYVKDFCRNLNVPLVVKYVDIEEMSKKEGISHEEAGRKARYQLFMDTAKEIGASRIALAHNMNDQAETILMRIMRGTGLEGLGGIKPVRDGMYIRPLLYVHRNEIEEYCSINNLNPRIDSSNLEPIYLRNKIRLQLLPYIRENYCPGIENILSSMAEILRDDNDFLDKCVQDIFKKNAVEKKDSVSIKIEIIKPLHISIKRRLLRKLIEKVKGSLAGIENRHIEILISIIDEGVTGSALQLPGKIKARISYGNLNIINSKGETNCKFNYRLNIPGRTFIKETGGYIESEIIHINSYETIPNNKFIKYFDYDKIKGILEVRSRQDGDYIFPSGMSGKKKLKDYFIDSKIPREDRDNIPIVALSNEILWIIGYRTSENYKITKDTNKILRLKYEKPGGDKNAE